VGARSSGGREARALAGIDSPDALSTVRQRCAQLTRFVEQGRSRHFIVDRARLEAAAEATVAATRERYPTLEVPLHSRWRHFDAGGVGRVAALDAALRAHSRADAARARADLTVVSVLLDAGAGGPWRYHDVASGVVLSRSEGLAVATLRAFMAGAFSAHADDPLRVDAAALARIDADALARIFQAHAGNPLVGLEGRAAMLRRLADGLHGARPTAWLDGLIGNRRFERATARDGTSASDGCGMGDAVSMNDVFATMRERLRFVLPGHPGVKGEPLGDCWPHPAAGGEDAGARLVPFHKLTQWLCYSLCEPLQRAGVRVDGTDALTALPEYRNGGLLLDTGVLRLRDGAAAQRAHPVGSELVVEWRALTVTLIDEVAARVRVALGRPALPLAAILEGGTWAAGRALAARLRNGAPPIAVDSDGTVF
jgi:hypothetical protein